MTEQRLENATYTAAEVKVLTEKAGEFGRLLGRQEALEAHNHAPVCCCVFQPENPCPICPKHGELIAATSGRTDPEEPK